MAKTTVSKKQVATLPVGAGTLPKLVKADLETAAKLQAFLKDGGVLTDVAGIGPEDAEEVMTALGK